MTGSGKTGLIHTSTEIQFLSISERYTHALPRNTKYLAIDGQVCFYRRFFADAVKPRRCMSWSWGTLIGLHGVPNCSSRQSGASLVDCTSSRHLLKAHHCSLSLNECFTPPSAPHPPPPPTPIESIRDITGAEKNHQKPTASK